MLGDMHANIGNDISGNQKKNIVKRIHPYRIYSLTIVGTDNPYYY